MSPNLVDVDLFETANVANLRQEVNQTQNAINSSTVDPDKTETLGYITAQKLEQEINGLKQMIQDLVGLKSRSVAHDEQPKSERRCSSPQNVGEVPNIDECESFPGSLDPTTSPVDKEKSRRRDRISSTRFDEQHRRDVSPMQAVPINQIPPPKFDGDKSKARSWLKEYEDTMEINGYSDNQKIKRALAYLSGEGREFYNVHKHRNRNLDWSTFKKAFLNHFCGIDGLNQLLIKLNETRQRSDEHPNSYAMRILNLCLQYDNGMSEQEQLIRVANGLRNTLNMAKDREEWTLDWLLSKLEAFEVERKKTAIETSRRPVTSPTQPQKATLPPNRPRDYSKWECFNCGEFGHPHQECKKPRDDTKIAARKAKYREEKASGEQKAGIGRVSRPGIATVSNLPCDNDLKPLLTVNLNGKDISGRIDSGADMTVLPCDVARRLNLSILPHNLPTLLAANQTQLKLLGMASVIIHHNSRTYPLLVVIMPKRSLHQPLWGNDFLRLFAVKLDFGIQNTQVETTDSVDVDTTDLITLSTAVVEQQQHPLDKVQFGDLDVETRHCFEDLLQEHSNTFSRNDQDIGRSTIIKHRIILADDKPVFKPPYRVPVRTREAMEEAIKEKLSTGAFRESISQFAAPVFFVDKDLGKSKRLVADYRALNAKTIPDRTPMPHPEDVFSLLGGSVIYAKLDITAMFNQIEVDERDVDKTAVTTPFGLFECPLMPFGLINAPATAVRLMKEVLRGLDGKIAFVYFDDIIVFAETSRQLVQRCTEVLERIRKHNLKLKPAKCIFGTKTVQFLGHVIDASGVHIDERRVEKVRSFPTPRDPSDVRSFLGLCSYNRKFIKDFAKISKPLTPLTGLKPKEFTWTSEAQQAFDTLKNTLVDTPTLVHFDPKACHELRTDASSYAIGAVLYQKSDDPKLTGIVLYYSKTLTSAQRNYSATERELLAAFSAIKDLKHYLYGKRFTLVTDHAALSLLRNHKDPHQRLARWVAQLQAFEFDVVYKRGAEHLDADCMSRLIDNKVPSDVDVDVEQGKQIVRAINSITGSEEPEDEPQERDMYTDQREDEFCREIIDVLESTIMTDDEKLEAAGGFSLQDDGKLYKVVNGALVLVIPERRRSKILLECHDSPLGAHLGFARTYALIKSRFYWPKLRNDVKKYVTTCDKCQRRKASNTRKQGLIKPLPISEDVFDTVNIDLITKLPNSNGFNTVLVCTDNLSKYVVTAPLKDESSQSVISAFFNFFIAKHGCPKLVISDRGANLIGEAARDFFELFGIKRQVTSPRHPQSNGQTERFNRTLGASLAIFVASSQKTWSSYLQAMTFAYNISEHSVLRAAPYELVFNRKPRLPVDNLMKRSEFIDPDQPNSSIRTSAAMQLMKGYILDSQLTNKRRLDQNRIPCTYKEGDLVVVERPTRVKGGVHKLSFSYVGPYKITRKIGDINFEITSLSPPIKTFVVHPAIIKRFHARDGDVACEEPSTFVPLERVQIDEQQSDAEVVDMLGSVPPTLPAHCIEGDRIQPPPLLVEHGGDE